VFIILSLSLFSHSIRLSKDQTHPNSKVLLILNWK